MRSGLKLACICIGILWMAVCGCVRDVIPDCPPMRVTLKVKDKNYFNIGDAVRQGMAEKVDENLPFRNYVGTIYYALYDEAGKLVYEKTTYQVEGDALEEVVTMPVELPYGKYRLAVWGNMKTERPIGDDDMSSGDLQHKDAVMNDIYTAEGTFTYAYGEEDYTLELQRAKGRLLIKAEGLPDYVNFSAKKMTNVFSLVTTRFEYSNPVEVMTSTDWLENKNEILTNTLYCPSIEMEKSILTVAFGERTMGARVPEGTPMLVADDVKVTVGRNELTIMKYIYDIETGKFDILIYLNDNWQVINDMEVED